MASKKWSEWDAITSPDDADLLGVTDTSSGTSKKWPISSFKAFLSALFAPIARGVTNGDSHDHSGGDGAQIDHAGLTNLTTGDPHTQYVETTGAESIDGVKTFTSFPVTPSSAPTTDYQTANKKYVDDNVGGGLTWHSGNNAAMVAGNTIDVPHTSDTDMQRIVQCTKEVLGSAQNENTIDMDAGDESLYTQFDCKQTAAYFQADTANTSGHFEDSGNTPVTVGSGNTCPKIQAGVRFKLDGDATIYEITSVTGDGEADDEIAFCEQDGSAATKATGTYTLEYVYGTEFSSGVVQLNAAGSGSYGSDLLTGGTPSASSEFSATYAASKACDDNASTFWQSTTSGAPWWWEYDFGVGVTKTIAQVTIYGYYSGGNNFIKDFKVQGSNNDSDWDDLYTGQTTNTNGVQTFQFSNTTAYRYIRFYITSGWGVSSSCACYEFEAMEQDLTYPVNEYYPVKCPQLAVDYWDDLTSMTPDDTPGGESAHYFCSFDGGTTYGIYDGTGGDDGWRPCLRDNSGTWEYNSNITAGATDITWTSATTNSELGAAAQAAGVTANQMDSTAAAALIEANLEDTTGGMNGMQPGTTAYIDTIVALKSTTSTVTPTISGIQYGYNSLTYYEDCDTNDPTEWVLYKYASNTVLQKTGSGTSNVKVRVGL